MTEVVELDRTRKPLVDQYTLFGLKKMREDRGALEARLKWWGWRDEQIRAHLNNLGYE